VCYYHLDQERDQVKRELCEYVRGEAEASLERLHRCAELETKCLCLDAGSAAENVRGVQG
jgi:hypothetical protein